MRSAARSAVILLFLFFLPLINRVQAATFSLTPDTKTLNPTDTLTVELKIDTAGQDVIDAEALLTFDPTILEFQSVNASPFFPIVRHNVSDDGTLAILGSIEPSGSLKKSSGAERYATLTFKALVGGDASLAFVCNAGGLSDSNILTRDPSDSKKVVDIINCSSLKDGNYTVTGPTGPPQPTKTATTPAPIDPTCDQCGYCKGAQKPKDWDQCKACIGKDGKTWTAIGCVPTSAGGFVQSILRFVLPLAGALSFLGILFGGFIFVTSAGDPIKLAQGKSTLIGSIGALLLIIFAIFLLRFVGFNVLGLPGFK